MGGKGVFKIVLFDSRTVVGYFYQRDSAVFYFDGYIRRTRVDRIFDEFFYDGTRSFDNFAGGNFVICFAV